MDPSPKRKEKAKEVRSSPQPEAAGAGAAPPRHPKTWLETHGRDLRFLGLFILFMAIYYVISTTSAMRDRFFPWYLEANARASVVVLNASGWSEVTRQGKSVSSPRGTITVARGCDAMEPVALFISAVLASPVSWGARAAAAIVGTALLLFINLIRIISLFLCAVYWRAAFDIMHLDVWQALFIFLAIFFWAIWAAWAVKRIEGNMSQQPRSAVSHVVAFLRGSDPMYRERGFAAIIRLLVLVSFYYAVGAALIGYWPDWRSGYQAYFRGLGNAAFEQFLIWPQASVHFLELNSRTLIDDIRAKAPPLTLPEKFPVPHRDKVMDTLMLLKNVNPARPGLGQFRTSSRLIGYWPIVTVMALALATPWMWRRKVWLLLWSLLVVHLFVVFRLAISLFQGGFADPAKSYRLFDISPWWFEQLKRFDAVLNDNVTFSFVGGVFVWLLVVIGLELWPMAWQKIRSKFKRTRSVGTAGTTSRQTFRDFERCGRDASRGRNS